MALGLIRAETILDLDDDTIQAKHCRTFLSPARDEVLSAGDWNFARKKENLGLLTTAPAFGHTYAHRLPNDFIRALRNTTDTIPYRVVGDEVHSDESVFKMDYIFREKDVTKWSPGFVMAVSYLLAAYIAYPITNSRSMAADMHSLYQIKLSDALSREAIQGEPIRVDRDDVDRARR